MQSNQLTPYSSTPDPGLVVSYAECLRFIKGRLSAFLHGDLKPWVEQLEPRISYTMVIGLKNDTLLKEAPKLVQRIMRGFGFDTFAQHRFTEDGRRTSEFVFPSKELLDSFHQQLAQYAPPPAKAEPSSGK